MKQFQNQIPFRIMKVCFSQLSITLLTLVGNKKAKRLKCFLEFYSTWSSVSFCSLPTLTHRTEVQSLVLSTQLGFNK